MSSYSVSDTCTRYSSLICSITTVLARIYPSRRMRGFVHGNVFLLVITCLEVEVETSDSNIAGRRFRPLNRPLLA
jgi:hypothetical protein